MVESEKLKEKKNKHIEKLNATIDPKYKKNSLIGLGDMDNLVAQVSDVMGEMYHATLVNPFSAENKVVAMPFHSMKLSYLYLGKIDSSDPSKYYVFITMDELKRAFDTKELKKEQLQRWLTFLQSPCHVERHGANRVVNFFSDSEIVLSDTGRLLGIRLACSPYSKDYIFNLSENHIKYVKVMVAYVMKFNCQYSINFFRHIVDKYQNVYGDKLNQEVVWEISFNDLKDLVKRNEPIAYDWNDFNYEILRKVVEDINTFTAYTVNYKKNSYSYVEFVTFTFSRNASIDEEMSALDQGNTYKPFYCFDSYKDYDKYKKSLDPKEQRLFEEYTYTKMVNGGLVPGMDSLRKELGEDAKYYSKIHLGWIAYLSDLFRDHTFDVYYGDRPVGDVIFRSEVNSTIFEELLDHLLSFQDIALRNCTNKTGFSIGQYATISFDDWIKKREKEILGNNRI